MFRTAPRSSQPDTPAGGDHPLSEFAKPRLSGRDVESPPTPGRAATARSSFSAAAGPLFRSCSRGGTALLLAAFLLGGGVVGLTAWQFTGVQFTSKNVAYTVTGLAGAASVLLALTLSCAHASSGREPRAQRLVVTLLWTPPILAVAFWLAPRFGAALLFWRLASGLYAALAVRSLFSLYIATLERGAAPGSAALQPSVTDAPLTRHALPLRCLLRPWRTDNGELLRRTSLGVWCYVVVQVSVTCVVFAFAVRARYFPSAASDLYGDATFLPSRAYIYMTAATNAAQAVGLYSLHHLVVALGGPLAPLQPWRKLAWVALVVFGTYWQLMVLTALLRFRPELRANWLNLAAALPGAHGMHAFLLSGEMVLAAVAAFFVFPTSDHAAAAPATHRPATQPALTPAEAVPARAPAGNRKHARFSLFGAPPPNLVLPTKATPPPVNPAPDQDEELQYDGGAPSPLNLPGGTVVWDGDAPPPPERHSVTTPPISPSAAVVPPPPPRLSVPTPPVSPTGTAPQPPPRASQPRASQTQQQRASETQQQRASETHQPRASQTQQPRASQTLASTTPPAWRVSSEAPRVEEAPTSTPAGRDDI